MKIFLFLLTLILTCPIITSGQGVSNVSKVGTTSAQFLKIEAGARAIAMGGAFVAVANDATALYWNAAGIARLSRLETILVHTNWLVDINFDFIALIIPMDSYGTLGLSITSLSMGEKPVRTVTNPEGTGEKYDAGDMAVALSYAKNLTDRFSIGFTTKYIQQDIWNMSASSFALDIGTLFTTGFYGMRIGMSISNFGNKMRLEGKDTQIFYDPDEVKLGNNGRIPGQLTTDEFALPLIFRVGLALDVINSERNRLTMAVDAVHPNDNTENLNLGVEYVYNELIFFRTGYKNLFTRDSEEGLTIGVGLEYNAFSNNMLRLDFAYQEFGIFGDIQKFSLGMVF